MKRLLPIFQVDAFSKPAFGGSPAAVVPLTKWLPDELLLAMAAENDLSEMAFRMPEEGRYALRWMTPEAEVPLCGHATLAAAWGVFYVLDRGSDGVVFRTRQAGELRARQLSKRGGELACRVSAERVALEGEAVLVLQGVLQV